MSLPGNIGLLSRMPTPSSSQYGNVDGPASSTDNAIVRFDGTTGKLIKNSTITLSGDTLTQTTTNGNIVLTPNGTGKVVASSGLNTAGAATFATYGANTLGGAGTTILPDVNAKLQIGRFSAGAPYSFIKGNSTSSGLKFTNAADSMDMMVLENSGKVTLANASMSIAGIGGAGAVLQVKANSITDTSSSGTVPNLAVNVFDTPTILASSATTWTDAYCAYFVAPVASTNATFTNRFAIGTTGDIGLTGTALIVKPGGTIPLITTNTAITDQAGVGVGTLTNAPTAGNPSKWILINDNGTVRKIPTWT
jgi:hypothetical protein